MLSGFSCSFEYAVLDHLWLMVSFLKDFISIFLEKIEKIFFQVGNYCNFAPLFYGNYKITYKWQLLAKYENITGYL